MADLRIDIRTKMIREDQKIWRLFPGAGYSLLEQFRENSVAFLDLPGLVLPESDFAADTPLFSERIKRSHAIRRWYNDASRSQMEGEDQLPARPPTDLRSYRDVRKPRNLGRDKGAVVGLFQTAKKGDLLVVPLPKHTGTFLVGEFTSGPEERKTHTIAEYGEDPVPARSVKWFPPVSEVGISLDIPRAIRKQNPFVAFNNEFYTVIFDRVFGTYVWGDEFVAKFTTRAARFTNSDNIDFVVISEALRAILETLESDEANENLRKIRKLWQLAADRGDDFFDSDLAINVNSPGSFLFKSKSIAPLFVVAMLALFQSQAAGTEIPTVSVRNSLVKVDERGCVNEVDEKVREALQMMHHDLYREACGRGARLREQPQLQGPARVAEDEPAPRRRR